MSYLNSTGLPRLVLDLKNRLVPAVRKINGKTLNADITLSSADIGYSNLDLPGVTNSKQALDSLSENKENLINSADAKTALIDNDTIPLTDSADGNKTKKITFANIKKLLATLASPAFTGTPTVPTAAVGTNNTQAASTAFVKQMAVPPTVPTFQNGFSQFAVAGWQCSHSRNESGLVTIRGVINVPSGWAGSILTMFTLPAGNRPKGNRRRTGLANTGVPYTNGVTCVIDIGTNGAVSLNGYLDGQSQSGTSYIHVDIEFSVE